MVPTLHLLPVTHSSMLQIGCGGGLATSTGYGGGLTQWEVVDFHSSMKQIATSTGCGGGLTQWEAVDFHSSMKQIATSTGCGVA